MKRETGGNDPFSRRDVVALFSLISVEQFVSLGYDYGKSKRRYYCYD